MRLCIVIVGAGCLAAIVVTTWPSRRRRDATFASPRDLRQLRGGGGQRIPLGRLHRRGLPGPTLHAPVRDSVLVLGPTGGGKTSSILVPALLGWEGPALAVSVKDDLLATTAAWRRRQGPIAAIDPTGEQPGMAVRFDPVDGVDSPAAARRVAASMCLGAAPAGGEAESRFWAQLAAKQLGPLLLAAHLDGVGIDEVARWVDRRDEATPYDLLVAGGELRSAEALLASLGRDERQLSSVYATVESILDPLLEHAPAGTTGRLDAAGLLAASGTLYLCAPAREQQRFATLCCAVVDEVLEAAVRIARRSGGTLEPRLLVVLDEAAAIAPIADLDVLAATLGGQGVSLVTCFQDLAQVEARWGAKAGTVLNNHRTRVLVAGLADPRIAGVLGGLVGTTRQGDRRRGEERRPLVEAAEIRQLPPFGALVVSGYLPVARVRLEPWWRRRDLAGRGPSTAFDASARGSLATLRPWWPRSRSTSVGRRSRRLASTGPTPPSRHERGVEPRRASTRRRSSASSTTSSIDSRP
jgi:type IV secretory pathway TraG/TraD family ATPase VirD4